MDLSKEYIKMCGKATEIQELQPETSDGYLVSYSEGGNFYYDGEETFTVGDVNLSDGINDEFTSERAPMVWLPRQDQLQKMGEGSTDVAKLLFFYDYIDELTNDYLKGHVGDTKKIDSLSLEQLWLMYVMKFNFNKTWDGENWN